MTADWKRLSGLEVDHASMAQQAVPVQYPPDISELFHLDKFLARKERLSGRRNPPQPVPGFPARIDSAAVWSGSTVQLQDFIHVLSSQDVYELETALSEFKQSKSSLNDISPQTFKLPTLGDQLRDLAFDVYRGRGVLVLRGLQPDAYSLADNMAIFAGIASYIAQVRGVQGEENDFLIHLRDLGSHIVPDHIRTSPFSTRAQAFHTDICDVIAMYVMETAALGGESYWASQAQVYNEVAANAPDIIHTLAREDWPFERLGPNGFHLRPILYPDPNGSERPFFVFSRANLTGTEQTPRSTSIPQLSEEQALALDTLHLAAQDNAITVKHQKGDMYFLNNVALLHGRGEFMHFDPDTGVYRERHLMRLWLRDEAVGRSIPEKLKIRWEDTFGPQAIAKGKWAMEKVHRPKMTTSNVNDESQSFS